MDRRLQAVVFDLFGTLVDNLDPGLLDDSMVAMAAELGANPQEFRQAWGQHFVSRMDGTIPDGDDQFLPILVALGLSADAQALSQATKVRRAFMRQALTPRPGAVAAIEEIIAMGLRCALASDCSSETPSLLDETALGPLLTVRACSAHLGVRKPDPRMYLHVLEELGVPGSACLFVGDGNSEELPGAKDHGMTTIWVDNGHDQRWRERFVPQGDHTIQRLPDVVEVVRQLV